VRSISRDFCAAVAQYFPRFAAQYFSRLVAIFASYCDAPNVILQ
jgi:hypothetical protein